MTGPTLQVGWNLGKLSGVAGHQGALAGSSRLHVQRELSHVEVRGRHRQQLLRLTIVVILHSGQVLSEHAHKCAVQHGLQAVHMLDAV